MVSGHGRRAGFVTLLLLLVSELPGQNASPLDRSIVVVLDASYSMGLRTDKTGQRRMDVALRIVSELARRGAPREEWALLLLKGGGEPELLAPFSLNPAATVGRRQSLEPDGATPLAAGLERAARYLTEEGGGSQKRIVLVSDGLATEDDAFRLPDPGYFRSRSIPVTALLCGVPELAERQADVGRLAVETGGAWFDAESALASGAVSKVLESLRRADVMPPPVPSIPVTEKDAPADPVFSYTPAPGGPAGVAFRALGVLAAGVTGPPPGGHARARVVASAVDRPAPARMPDTTVVAARTVSFRLIWLNLPLLGVAAWRLSRRIAVLLRTLGTPRVVVSSRPVIRLDVRSAAGAAGPVVLRTVPALIGGSERADLRLPRGSGPEKRPDFEIGVSAMGAEFRSAVPLNVNGVARTHKLLRGGDSVAYDGHRIVFRDVSSERVVTRRPAAASGLPWELVLLGVGLLVGILLWRPITVTLPRRAPRPHAVSVLPSGPVLRLEVVPADVSPPGRVVAGSGFRVSLAGGRAASGGRALSSGSLTAQAASLTPSPAPGPPDEPVVAKVPLFTSGVPAHQRAAVEVFSGDDPVVYTPADALFVHAHPDDESIDFGILIARLAASGKRVVVVLLTDGESGLDQYPDRSAGGAYADRGLWPEELAALRPVEARGALSILGARTYVRLGLRNHPYASNRQVLGHSALMAAWGGEAAVVTRLVEIIEGFRPALVVSPDSAHGGAHEHFEHAGAGYLVREALRRVRLRGRHTVIAHARSVDPRFRDTYDDVQALDSLEHPGGGELTYRGLQVRALKEHRTQRDATVVALETLTSQRWEYYVTTFWGEALPLDRFLRTW